MHLLIITSLRVIHNVLLRVFRLRRPHTLCFLWIKPTKPWSSYSNVRSPPERYCKLYRTQQSNRLTNSYIQTIQSQLNKDYTRGSSLTHKDKTHGYRCYDTASRRFIAFTCLVNEDLSLERFCRTIWSPTVNCYLWFYFLIVWCVQVNLVMILLAAIEHIMDRGYKLYSVQYANFSLS